MFPHSLLKGGLQLLRKVAEDASVICISPSGDLSNCCHQRFVISVLTDIGMCSDQCCRVLCSGCKSRRPVSSGGGSHRPESDGETGTLQPLQAGVAVQGQQAHGRLLSLQTMGWHGSPDPTALSGFGARAGLHRFICVYWGFMASRGP